MTEGTDMIENVARPKLVDELALAIDQFLTHRIERDTLACDLTQDELTELATGLAAIAAMQPAPQWKWIGSAPRNGTCVLLWIPADDGWHAYIASGWYESGVFDNRWYAAMDENPLSPQPTHWMPLPTPPAGGSYAE